MAQRPRTLQPQLSGRHLLGALLRSLRQTCKLSQAQLGEMVFCSGHLIGKIEKAERRAQPDLVKRCDDVLQADGQLIELLDAAETDLLRAKRMHYERMYRHVGGVPVAPMAEAFLRSEAAPMLRTVRVEQGGGRRLRLAVCGLSAMAGICAYDAERHEKARQHFQRALDLSADDPALTGYVRALMTNQALCLNDHQLAISHADAALRAGGGTLSAALRTDLHAMQAKAYAQMGRRDDCLDQMRRADIASGVIKVHNEPAETSYVHPGLLELKQAEALLPLGDLKQARALAEMSLMLGPPDPRGHFYAYATLALVYVAMREVDQGVTWTWMALELAKGMDSRRVNQRLKMIVESIEPYRNLPSVRELLAEIRQALVMPS